MKKLRSIISDRRGFVWVWMMFFIAIPVMVVVYIPLSSVFDSIFASVNDLYVFTGATAIAMTFAKVFVSYVLAFFMLLAVNWVYIQSKGDRYGGAGP